MEFSTILGACKENFCSYVGQAVEISIQPNWKNCVKG